MTYSVGGLVEATDYNNLVGSNPGTDANKLNTVWAVGGVNAGYGQTVENTVTVGDQVTAQKMANLVNKTANAASHQGSSITAVVAPSTGSRIEFLSAIPNNLTTIYTNRLNASIQGSTSANAVSRPTTWTNAVTFTHTITFANADATRYFFNSGGQLAITCSHPGGTGINGTFNTLATNVGTVVLSAPSSGTISITGTTYRGITKIGGGGSTPTILQNNGYYALTTSNANVFTQVAGSGPSYYSSSFIRIIAKSNGTQGSNGDAGNIITIYTLWDQVPNGLTASIGSSTTCTIRAPETTYIANSWGSISITGTQSGS